MSQNETRGGAHVVLFFASLVSFVFHVFISFWMIYFGSLYDGNGACAPRIGRRAFLSSKLSVRVVGFGFICCFWAFVIS